MINNPRKKLSNKLYECLEPESNMTWVYPFKKMKSGSFDGMASAVCFYGLREGTPSLFT